MKKTLLILSGLAVVILAHQLLTRIFASAREHRIEVESIETTRYNKFVAALTSTEKFKDAKFVPNEKMDVVNIDGEYDVTIKSGSYVMIIRDAKLESGYCEIVDAIETALGVRPGASVETCTETLKGTIGLGGITADIFDDYKVLTVVSDEPAKLYKVMDSHISNELISVDEEDYDISIEGFVITSMRMNYVESSKLYSVCGNIFNPKKTKEQFTIKIYDSQKEELAAKDYSYQNETKKYISFCTDFTLETNGVKYYSIGVE